MFPYPTVKMLVGASWDSLHMQREPRLHLLVAHPNRLTYGEGILTWVTGTLFYDLPEVCRPTDGAAPPDFYVPSTLGRRSPRHTTEV